MERRLLKASAAGLWSACVLLFVIGLMQERNPIDYYAFGCLAAFGGCISSGWLIVAKETRRSRDTMAEAIGRAVANELAEREGHSRLHSV